MLLTKDLPSAGYLGDPEGFRNLVAELSAAMFPGHNAEWILIDPTRRALPFCRAVRRESGAPGLPEGLILGTLLQLRKEGRLPAARAPQPVLKAIRSLGFRGEPAEFRRAVLATFRARQRGRSDEWMLKRPTDEAIPFCRAVRARLGLPSFPDRVILEALLNLRRRGGRNLVRS